MSTSVADVMVVRVLHIQGVEAGLTGGIDADYASFTASASRGDGALGGLTAAMIIASLLMAAGCAWGLTRRLAEYR